MLVLDMIFVDWVVKKGKNLHVLWDVFLMLWTFWGLGRDIFGFSSFVRLSEKLGLKDIFQPKLLKEQSKQLQVASLVQVSESNTLDLRGSVEDYQSCNQIRNEEKERSKRRKKRRNEVWDKQCSVVVVVL